MKYLIPIMAILLAILAIICSIYGSNKVSVPIEVRSTEIQREGVQGFSKIEYERHTYICWRGGSGYGGIVHDPNCACKINDLISQGIMR